MEKDISPLEEKLDVKFKDQNLLRQALVHRSYLNEHRDFPLDQNERLEFLGDAVLELVVTDHLYGNYPNPEGELTNWRASLVNSQMLSLVAEQLGVEEFLYLSRGETREANTKARQSILANALEAIIGAIYLDADFDAASTFIHKNIISKLPHILKNKLYMDAKSRFQETAQEMLGITPSYEVLEESGPDHDKKFVVGVFIGEERIAEGHGTSKQEAQMDAANEALEAKGWQE
ncbi:MAG: ribonuclease III [Candidatus Kerfeldbacteria bacterium]